MADRLAPRRALLSVSDKTGLVHLGKALSSAGVELIASGGTADALRAGGLDVTDVSSVTGHAEMLGGRVKTLHPAIHAGILARIDQLAELKAAGYEPIDVVVVNLYPFTEAVASGGDAPQVIEEIDIGGPTLVRAAAKNHERVAVVTDVAQHDLVADALAAGGTTADQRRELAAAAFAHTAGYEIAIAEWFSGSDALPDPLTQVLRRREVLRYGENPHQSAALYVRSDAAPWWQRAVQLQGKAMSFNNYADAEAAWRLAAALPGPGCVIVKHANPCGVALADTPEAAFRTALACDPTSAFGGIVAITEPVDEGCAQAIAESFFEVVIAPEIDADARSVLAAKKNLRVLAAPPFAEDAIEMRPLSGGALVQTTDDRSLDLDAWRVVGDAQPHASSRADLELAWVVAAHCKSNAIVIVADGAAVGIGVGDQSRVGAAARAIAQAGDRARGGAAASEAFLPFRDTVDTLAAAGVTALVEPGGSKRDDEVIAAANEHEMSLVFTGKRHFLH